MRASWGVCIVEALGNVVMVQDWANTRQTPGATPTDGSAKVRPLVGVWLATCLLIPN